MVVAEGVGRRLNPDVNMWQLAQPLVEDWIIEHLGPKARFSRAIDDGLSAMARLPRILDAMEQTLERRSEDMDEVGHPLISWGIVAALVVGIMIGLILA